MNNDVAIVEIRPAAGGDEAKIWAKDLMRMYTKFAASQNWQVEPIDSLTLKIKGENAFGKLKNESGVHRVQRVPTTEKRGRIHTSTASVADSAESIPPERPTTYPSSPDCISLPFRNRFMVTITSSMFSSLPIDRPLREKYDSASCYRHQAKSSRLA